MTNEDSGDLSVVAKATNEVLETISVGKGLRGVKVSPDGRTVLPTMSPSSR